MSTVNNIEVSLESAFGRDIVYKLFNDYTIVTDYPVFNGEYTIDWYIPELNLAIEFDRSDKITTQEDRIREKRIEAELGCKFARYEY